MSLTRQTNRFVKLQHASALPSAWLHPGVTLWASEFTYSTHTLRLDFLFLTQTCLNRISSIYILLIIDMHEMTCWVNFLQSISRNDSFISVQSPKAASHSVFISLESILLLSHVTTQSCYQTYQFLSEFESGNTPIRFHYRACFYWYRE